MSTLVSTIETLSRLRLGETTASFWTSAELVGIITAGIRDLWRDIADLKGEHYLKVNDTDVFLVAGAYQLSGVPADVHKVYLLEARDTSSTSANVGLIFTPLEFNHETFQMARSRDAIDPSNEVIYYAVASQGAPVSAPIIYTAPATTSNVNVTFYYVPSLGDLESTSTVPIPGEADNALVAWTVAFARAKEREDRAPDPSWLSIYATEKTHLLQSLGLRQYQEPAVVDAFFQRYW